MPDKISSQKGEVGIRVLPPHEELFAVVASGESDFFKGTARSPFSEAHRTVTIWAAYTKLNDFFFKAGLGEEGRLGVGKNRGMTVIKIYCMKFT